MNLINILIRTCKRPEYFKNCINSIASQTYKNINIIIGIEEADRFTESYVDDCISGLNISTVKVFYKKEVNVIDAPKNIEGFGGWFPYNKYLDILGQSVKSGYVMYFDDDDKLVSKNSIESIIKNIDSEDDLIFWRVKFNDRLVPEDNYWNAMLSGGAPTCYHISGGGFCFHSKYLSQIEWGYWKMGDYRVSNKLHSLCKNKKYINSTITGLQDFPNGGKINYIEHQKTNSNKKMARILFLYPSLISGWNSYRERGNSESSYADHGLAMLSAVLKREGHQTMLVDMRTCQSWQHFEKIIKQSVFDLVCVSFYSANEKYARQALSIIKRIHPKKYIIGGGVHLSVTKTTQYPNIDSIVHGEGEPHIINIVNDIMSGIAPKKVYELTMVDDLDSLPYVDRNLFNPRVEETSPLLSGLPEPFVTIVAGRGCPHLCAFCSPSRSLINGNKCRIRSVDHFLGEIVQIYKERGKIGSLMIHDDLLGTKKWIEELITKWHQNLPRIPFWCQLRADTIIRIKDYIPALAEIGLSYVSIGMESGSNRMLEFLKKGTTVEQNIEAAKILHDNDINIFANFISGLPTETDEDRAATEKMIAEIKPAYLAASIYTFYPGSSLHDWIIENNYLAQPEQHYSQHRFPFERKIKDIDYDVINNYIKELNNKYKGELRTYRRKLKPVIIHENKPKCKVSVIIVTYKRPEFLDRAIESIMKQTLQDWEIILIDNNFNEIEDVNKAVYEKYSNDNRIKWIKHPKNINNIGLCWNEGIDHISGQYWCTLDDDNTKLPLFLEKMTSFLDSHPENDAVVCPSIFTGVTPQVFYRKPISFGHLRSANHIDSGQVVWRKSVLNKIGYFDENIIMCEDWDYMIRAYALNNLSGSAFGWLDGEPLCTYHWHNSKRMLDTEISSQEDKFREIIQNKKIVNTLNVRIIAPANNVNASQKQLFANIGYAIKSIPFVKIVIENPDVILITGTIYNLTEATIHELRTNNPKAQIVALFCEDAQATQYNIQYSPYLDWIVSNDYNSYKYYINNIKPEKSKKVLYWNCLSISNELLYFLEHNNPEKEYDVCIVGYAYQSRIDFIKELQSLGGNIKYLFIGDGWRDAKVKGDIFPTMNEIDTARQAMKSKIILLRHRTEKDLKFVATQPISINRGYIEAAYRSVVMIDNSRSYHSFPDESICFYNTASDCYEKISENIKNFGELKDKLESLYNYAVTNFTHRERLIKILNCVRSERHNICIK